MSTDSSFPPEKKKDEFPPEKTEPHSDSDLEANVDSPSTNFPREVDSIPESDSNLVGWDEPEDQDPANPKNWSKSQRWTQVFVLSAITFLTPLASSMFAPGVPQVMEEFHSDSTTLATFVVAVFVLGFAFGPLLLAPLSEIYGRVRVYNVCNVLFLIFTIVSAVANSLGMLITIRFLAGVFGVAVITCGGGSISDMMPPQERGAAMSFWSVGPILGPIIGPVVGGFLVEAKGWRWVFWLLSILSGVFTVLSFIFLKETYAPVLLERKAQRLRKETGNNALRSKLDSGLSQKDVFIHSIVRPCKLFIFSPIVSLMCIYTAVAYGLLYILFTTFTYVFEDSYGFSTSNAGLSFLGSGVGTLCGLLFVGIFSDRTIRKVIAEGKTPRPEDRLPLLITFPAALSLPAGLFIYGWSTDKHVHWIVPELGTAITGFGMISLMMCIQTYLIDAFTAYAASVTAANAVLRSLLGALLPLGGLHLYDSLGLGWGNSVLGFAALVLAPVPWFFRIYGERVRTNPKRRVKF